jgi:MFS family permease
MGASAAVIASQILDATVAWHLYEQTHSFRVLFFIGLATYLPIFVFSLPAGLLVDHFERKKILLGTSALAALSIAWMAWLSHVGAAEWLWYLALFFVATARAFQTPAAVSYYPTLLPREAFVNAVSWNSSNFQIGAIVGPILAGLLLHSIHSTWTLFWAAFGPASFFLLIMGQKPLFEPEAASDQAPLWERLGGGMSFIRGQKAILSAITLDLFAVLFGGVEGIMPAFANDILKCGPVGYGVLKAAPFIGALLMGLLIAHRPSTIGEKAGQKMLWAVAGFGLCMITFGASSAYPLSLAALFVSGALDNISVVVRQSLVQLRTPEHLRGRVQAINFLFIGSSNELGFAESGGAAWLLGAVPSVIVGGSIVLLVVGLIAWTQPELKNLGRLQ